MTSTATRIRWIRPVLPFVVVCVCAALCPPNADGQARRGSTSTSSRVWRTSQEEDIQYAVFRYLFKTWGKKWPGYKSSLLNVLGVNAESNPVRTRLFKRLRKDGYPVEMGYQPRGIESLDLSLSNLRWIRSNSVQIRSQVFHGKPYDPTKPILLDNTSVIFYGEIRVKHTGGRWKVLGLKGKWEQPE